VSETTAERLTYLYGIVPGDAPDPTDELRGVDDAAVRLVRTPTLAAAVSDLDAAHYVDEALEARLDDLAWVGERGVAHERVLDWFAERGPVIPLSLFSLHRDDQRVRERLQGEEERLAERLERLRGTREWGVKLWRRDAQLAEHLQELSPSLHALQAEMESAPPGRRFLLGKKRDALHAEELRRVAARVTHQVYAALREAAAEATTTSLPPSPSEAERVLALHAAFLVPDAGFPAFQQRLGELAVTFQPLGFEFEFTGPWPPYHFAESHGR
jgi:hypothetical protein